jgi:ATP/maltotriose-dependent transcriptional regulator MalT
MRSHQVPELEILAWMALGVVHLLACRLPQAQAALGRAEKIGQRLGADHFSATVDICRGWMAGSQGQVAAALDHLASARAVAEATGATRGLGWCHYFAATALLRDQRHSDALIELEQSRRVFAAERANYFLTLIECRRTIALARLGRLEDAALAHRAAGELAAGLTGVPLDLVVALDRLHLDIAVEHPDLAERHRELLRAVEERGLGRYEPITESLEHLEPWLAREDLIVRDDFAEIRIGDRRIDLERQASARRMLRALIESGRSLTVVELFAAGWPDDHIPVPAATRRVYSGIHSLRKQGLEPFLRHTGDGYALVARIRFEVARVRSA